MGDGHPIHVVEAVLNHKSGVLSGVAAIYNRHDYLEEKKRALESWMDHVQEVLKCRTTIELKSMETR